MLSDGSSRAVTPGLGRVKRRIPAATGSLRKRYGRVKPAEGFVRGILLWLVGLPIPIIILLYLFHVI